MGKISNALERHKKEKSINAKRLPIGMTGGFVEKGAQSAISRKSIIEHSVDPKMMVLSAPESMDAENFKVLRSRILFPKEGKRPTAIMVTSALPGEGKTLVAANLAVSIAQGINEHVMLVDSDLRRPSMLSLIHI